MTDHHSTPQYAQADPPAPTPPPRTAPSRWHHVVIAGVYLELFVWTLRTAIHEQGTHGVWVTILFWVFMGTPAAIEQYDRAHGRPRPLRTHKWT